MKSLRQEVALRGCHKQQQSLGREDMQQAPYYLSPKHKLLKDLEKPANNSHIDARGDGETRTVNVTENTEKEPWALDNGFSLVA